MRLIGLLSVLVCIFIFHFSSLAQSPSRDSLFQIWENKAHPDSLRMDALGQMIQIYYLQKKPDSTRLYSQELFDLAERLQNKYYEAIGLHYLAMAAITSGAVSEAKPYAEKALKLWEVLDREERKIEEYSILGIVNEKTGDLERALDYFEKGMHLCFELGDSAKAAASIINTARIYESRGEVLKSKKYNELALSLCIQYKFKHNEAIVRNNLANNYKDLGDIPKAAEQYTKSFGIYEADENFWGATSSLNNLAVLYINNSDFPKAKEYLDQSLELSLSHELFQPQSMTYANLAYWHFEQKQYAKSLEFNLKGLQVVEEHKMDYMKPFMQLEVGRVLQSLGRLEEAAAYLLDGYNNGQRLGRPIDKINARLYLSQLLEEQGDWVRAIAYGEEGYKMAQEFKTTSAVGALAEQLYKLHKKLGNSPKALNMHEIHIAIKDSLFSEENSRALIRQEYDYNYQKKVFQDSIENAAALEIQEADIRRRRNLNWSLGGILLLTILFGAIVFSRYRIIEKQKKEIQKAKNKAESANAKLLEIDQTKSHFFTNISHEFRTPLTVISGMAKKISEQPDQWLNKGIKMVSRNADHLLNLTNQILDLRKLEAGKLKPNWIQSDIIAYLQYIFESFHSMGEAKEIELSFQAKDQQLNMDFDPELLMRIVSNLLSNAIKYSEAGGEVQLKVASIASPQGMDKDESETLFFSIKDKGIGIPPEKLPYIFDRFYQVDHSPTRQGEGTGIGLALTRELVHLLGGKIEVESALGIGSTFSVWLPIQRTFALLVEDVAAVKMPSPALEMERPFVSERQALPRDEALPNLLIIEDNVDVRQYLGICLEGHYQLSYASDGEEGINKALEGVPDIIISDVMMPKKDGYEVCRFLKNDLRTSHIPIILLTAKSDAESKISGLEVGADAYLAKPFNEKELFVRLEKLLEIRKKLQEHYQTAIGVPLEESFTAYPKEDAFIKEAQNIILANISDETFGIAELCKGIGMSRAQLHNKLKSLTGKSTSHFIRSIRIHKAKELLIKNPELNITEITFEAGFSNLKYFSRIFSEEIGLSPSQFRKKNAPGQ